MAVNPVTLAESLRPWRYAGILAILASEGSERSLPEDGETCLPEDEAAFRVPEEEAASFTEPVGASVTHSSPALAQTPAASRQGRKFPQTPAAHANHSLPENPDDFSLPWRELLARTTASPIIWTYAELGDDLAGKGSKERSACLRRIIGSLHLPKGSSAFWPLRLPCDLSSDSALLAGSGEPSPASEEPSPYFQRGLRVLKPKILIFLGVQALQRSGLDLPLGTAFTQTIHKGMACVLLPNFAALLAKPSLADQCCAFLRSALSGFSLK